MQSGLRLCACTAIGLAMTGSISFAAEYELRAGTAISQVRAQLLKGGWTPVRIDKNIYFDNRPGNQIGDGKALFAAGYFEVESCDGSGADFCDFNYQKNGQCLRLTTRGEYDPPVYEPYLFKWNNKCPD